MDQSGRSVGVDYWRASEASETLSGVYKFELVRYIYIYIYIYILRTPPRCSVEINVFELG